MIYKYVFLLHERCMTLKSFFGQEVRVRFRGYTVWSLNYLLHDHSNKNGNQYGGSWSYYLIKSNKMHNQNQLSLKLTTLVPWSLLHDSEMAAAVFRSFYGFKVHIAIKCALSRQQKHAPEACIYDGTRTHVSSLLLSHEKNGFTLNSVVTMALSCCCADLLGNVTARFCLGRKKFVRTTFLFLVCRQNSQCIVRDYVSVRTYLCLYFFCQLAKHLYNATGIYLLHLRDIFVETNIMSWYPVTLGV